MDILEGTAHRNAARGRHGLALRNLPGVLCRRLPDLLVALLLALAILGGQNYATRSDPHGSLLVSTAIIEHGTIKLDAYRDRLAGNDYKIKNINGHLYYFFPLGTSLLAVPAVAAAKMLGVDVIARQAAIQLAIAALVLMASFMMLRRLAAMYLSLPLSNVVAATYLLASPFVSTGVTALWSHDFAALFALLSIYILLDQKRKAYAARTPLFAICLFMGYLCRPTLLILVPVAIGIQFLYVGRRAALLSAVIFSLACAVFCAFSWLEYGQWLPEYYLPKRLDGTTFWTALYGNLLSPSRGLLVFCPFLLLPLLAVFRLWRRAPECRAELLLLVWPVLHLVAISRFPHWWAGFSYGPRLMYDVLPGLFVCWVVYISRTRWRVWRTGIAVIAVVVALLINYGQGIFNRYTGLWNAEPNVDLTPQLLFDWRYPQFANTKERHAERLNAFNSVDADRYRAAEIAALPPEQLMALSKMRVFREKSDSVARITATIANNRVHAGSRYGVDDDALVFAGWQKMVDGARRSNAYYAEIGFMPDAQTVTATSLQLDFVSLHEQVLTISVNKGEPRQFPVRKGPVSLRIDVAGALTADVFNAVQIEMPQAKLSYQKQPGAVSLQFMSLRFDR